MISKFSPFLLLIAAGLFFMNGFLTSGSKAVYITLGTVFLVLGIAALRRRSKQ